MAFSLSVPLARSFELSRCPFSREDGLKRASGSQPSPLRVADDATGRRLFDEQTNQPAHTSCRHVRESAETMQRLGWSPLRLRVCVQDLALVHAEAERGARWVPRRVPATDVRPRKRLSVTVPGADCSFGGTRRAAHTPSIARSSEFITVSPAYGIPVASARGARRCPTDSSPRPVIPTAGGRREEGNYTNRALQFFGPHCAYRDV